MFRQKNIKQNAGLQNIPDNELINIYKTAGHVECIGELFNRYTHLVFGICVKYYKNEMKAEDAVMSIFESLFEKLETHTVDNFKNWLYSVARNYCLMEFRKEKTQRSHIEKYIENDQEKYVEPEPFLHQVEEEKKVKISKLQTAINLLKEEQKKCIELMYIKEMSYKEIADLTGFALKEVKSYIQNGKRNLRNLLEG